MDTASQSGGSSIAGDSSGASSHWSAGSGEAESTTGGPPGDLSQDLLEQDRSLQAAIFGAVHKLACVKYGGSLLWALLRVFLDYAQLWLLIGNPHLYWTFDTRPWPWRLFRWLLLVNPVIDKGYDFYVTVLYVAVFLIAFSIGSFVFIAWRFMCDMRLPEWLVQINRWLVVTFCIYLCPSSMALFIAALDCRPFSQDPNVRNHMDTDGNIRCTDVPHIIHLGFAVVASLLFFLLTFAVSVSDFDPKLSSDSFLGQSQSFTELASVICKFAMIVGVLLVDDAPKFKGMIMMGASVCLVYLYLKMKPHYNEWANHLRCALYGSLAWMSLLYTILVFTRTLAPEDPVPDRCTKIMLIGLAPSMLLFGGLSYWHLNNFMARVLVAFRDAPPTGKAADILHFSNIMELEIATRIARYGGKDGVLDAEHVKLAELVLRAGTAIFPNEPYMAILNANFLMEVKGGYQTGYSQLMTAKKLRPHAWLQYLIFVREQEHKLRARAQSGQHNSVDLATYVEFARNYKLLMKRHKDTLKSIRGFWRILLRNEIKFTSLQKAFKRVEAAQLHACKTYSMVLERHPFSVKLLRSYAAFLEEAMNDPWTASRYYTDADKLEAQEEEEGEKYYELGDGGDSVKQVSEKDNGTIVINANGIVQSANKCALQLLGYKQGELVGKNVSVLMPAPFGARHSSYVAAFLKSGREDCFQGKPRALIALHKAKYVIPISIEVHRVSGLAQDSTFMGVFTAQPRVPGVVTIWMTTTGVVVCVDQSISDVFGISPAEVVGMQIMSLVAQDNSAMMQRAISEATGSTAAMDEVACCVTDVLMLHKYLEPLRVDITFKKWGTDSTPMFVLDVRQQAKAIPSLLVTDSAGRMVFATSAMAGILGYEPEQLVGSDMSKLMSPPFSHLHGSWMKDMSGRQPLSSCRSGILVSAFNSSGRCIPVKISIATKEDNDDTLYISTVERGDYNTGLDQRRLQLHLDADGVVTQVSNATASVFGFRHSVLVGKHISQMVDVFAEVKAVEGLEAVNDLLHALGARSLEFHGSSWRVGVHPPDDAGDEAVGKPRPGGGLDARKPKAAVMQVEVLDEVYNQDEHDGDHSPAAMVVDLYRAELLAGVLEVDKEGTIVKSGSCPLYQPGPIFGCSSASMLRLPISNFLSLGQRGLEAVLFGHDANSANNNKKGSLKNSSHAPTSRLASRVIDAIHDDGRTFSCLVQACYKDASMKRICLRVGLNRPACGDVALLRRSLLVEPKDMPTAASALTSSQHRRADFSGAKCSPLTSQSLAFISPPRHPPAAGGAPAKLRDSLEGAPQLRHNNRARVSFADGSEEAAPEALEAALMQRLGISVDSDFSEGDFCGTIMSTMQPGLKVSQKSRIVAWIDTFEQEVGGLDCPETEIEAGPDGEPDPGMGDRGAPLFDGGNNLDANSQGSDDIQQELKRQGGRAVEWQSDFKRGKRCKKIAKLLLSSSSQKHVQTFSTHVVYVLVGLLVAHVVAFCVFTKSVGRLRMSLGDVRASAQATDYMHRACHATEVIRNMLLGTSSPLYSPYELPQWVAELDHVATQFQNLHFQIYLGRKELRKLHNVPGWPMQSLLERPSVQWQSLVDTTRPFLETVNITLWDAGNELASAFQELFSNYELLAANGSDLASNRFFQVVRNNAQTSFYNSYTTISDGVTYQTIQAIVHVKHLGLIMLLLEGCLVCTIAAAYVYWLLGNVAGQRYNLYSVFLMVPSGCLRALATKQLHIGVEDDDDDDNERGMMDIAAAKDKEVSTKYQLNFQAALDTTGMSKLQVMLARAKQLSHWVSLSHQPIVLNKKRLLCNSLDTYTLMMPFVVWMMMLLLCYGRSYMELLSSTQHIAETSLTALARAEVSRVLFQAHRICSEQDGATQGVLLDRMLSSLLHLERKYRRLLYGGTIDPSSHIFFTSGGTTFTVSKMTNLVFRDRSCLYAEGSTCATAGSPYYQVFHNGLDAVMRRFLLEGHLMSKDNATDMNLYNPRLKYLWAAARNDLHAGMSLAEGIMDSTVSYIFDHVTSWQIIVFAIGWVLALLYLLAVLKPFLNRNRHEVDRMADMLSQLPPDMDVELLVEQALYPEREAARQAREADAAQHVPRNSLSAPSGVPSKSGHH